VELFFNGFSFIKYCVSYSLDQAETMVRMGKLAQKERIGKNYPKRRPQFSSAGLIVGQVSSNLINSVYLPLWEELATKSMQDYLQSRIEYDEAVKEAETYPDRNVTIPVEPKKPAFHSQFVINDFKETLEETAKHFSTLNGWKIHANAAKFERLLDEKYGIFRPFITNHPEIEAFVKGVQRKWAMGHFSPFRPNGPPIARSTSIILLFMMQRNNVSWKVLTLAALFLLVGLQPWALVCIVAILHYLLERRRRKVMGKMDSPHIPVIEPYYSDCENKEEKLFQAVGQKLSNVEIDMTTYDTMILGGGPSALYTASLLSRAGRKVLMLSHLDDASGCLSLTNCKDSTNIEKKFRHVPFDIEFSNVSRITRQQELLVPALCTSTDYQGGIRFAKIGTEANGYAFEVLAIPGMGTSRAHDEVPFVLRAQNGLSGLMDDTARYLGDGWPGLDGDVGNSLSGAYVTACLSMNASASEFFLSKIIPDNANDMRARSMYQEASIRHASNFLDQCFPLNAHVRSLFAGIGMKGENLKPCKASMGAHVTNVCSAVCGEGMYYPIGGPRALCHALANVVEQCGGKVIAGVQFKELIFEDKGGSTLSNSENASIVNPRCVGIKLIDGRKITFPARPDNGLEDVVISTTGFIDTFIRLMPPEIREKYHVPRGLPALSERRPIWKILFALSGTVEELMISGADYYRLPNASLAFDEFNAATGAVSLGVIGGKEDDESTVKEISLDAINAPAAESSSEKNGKSKKQSKVKYFIGKSWMHISFPSAKDPSFATRHGNINTCVVTVEADDDFVTLFDSKPKLFSTIKKNVENSEFTQRLLERVLKDLLAVFPQLDGKIDHSEVRGPFCPGLSHTPERYAAKGIRPDTPYPNLFVGGSDLTIGDSFSGGIVSGWLTANAVMGYTSIDHLFLKKNITSDLARYIERPGISNEEDVAVPLAQNNEVQLDDIDRKEDDQAAAGEHFKTD
jgi:phytoene dehydrogenase-like protein